MDISLGLSILPEKIEPLAWLKVYAESLKLLRQYPFASLKTVPKGEFEITVYSSQVEHDLDDFSKRHWSVCGDLKSKKMGEPFFLYSDLNHYLYLDPANNRGVDAAPDDIVTTLLDKQAGRSKNVFCSETRGYPYHNYILALAMLFETRLAPYAVLEGLITYGQAQKAREWAGNILLEPLQIPLLLCPEKLKRRLEKSLDGLELIEALQQVWPGDRQVLFNYCLQTFEQGLLEKGFSGGIKESKSKKRAANATPKGDYWKEDELFLYYDENTKLNETQKMLIHTIAAIMWEVLQKSEPAELIETAREKGWKWIIYNTVELEKLIFTEDAWQWIDAEEDEQLLQMLFVSIVVYKFPGLTADFGSFVRALFENRKFALKVKELSG